jgi:predicted permease
LSDLLTLFLDNLLPIFLAAGSGYLLSKFLHVNPRHLSQVIFYVFSPCLIFSLIVNSNLSNGDILRMLAFAAGTSLLVGTLALAAGRLLKLERRMLAAVILTSMFMNAGNFGLSLTMFAFGQSALAYASLYFVTNSMLIYSVGVIIASMGRTSFTQALLNLVKIPAIYAVVLAFVFLSAGWQLPLPLDRTVTLLGEAAIPTSLVLLGLQFPSMRWAGRYLPLTLTNVLRLLVSPAIALGLSLIFGLQGAARQAGIIESAMPTAVMTTVVATEFDTEPAYVTSAVFITTLLSALTLTPLLAYLRG